VRILLFTNLAFTITHCKKHSATHLRVALDPQRLRGFGVPTKVGTEDPKASVDERGKLPTPAEPEVRKAVHEANGRRVGPAATARLHHVQRNSVIDGDVVVRQSDAANFVELG